jgi:hypothetical protein
MAAETQYTANTGTTQITAANTALNGTGTLNTNIWMLVRGGSNGTLVKSITIKAAGTTAEGMVRFFLFDGTNTRLLHEVDVIANTPSATNPAFEFTWNCNMSLKTNFEIRVTTQIANTFNIISDSLDWNYYTPSVRQESTNFTANTGTAVINVANTTLTGGTLNTNIWSAITAGSSATFRGCRIDSLTIKAQGTTTMGMIRIYIFDTTNYRLFKEIPVPAIVQTGTEKAFQYKLDMNGFSLKAGWELRVSTEKAETFSIIVEGNDWRYPANPAITNYTPASNTAVTTEELLHSLQVPAGLFSTGNLMEVYSSLLFTNSANLKTYKIYINTSNSLTGATLLSNYRPTVNGIDNISRLYPVINDTTLENYGGTGVSNSNQYTANTGTSANITVPSLSAGFWILISGQKAVAGETSTLRWSMVNKVF